MISISKAFYAAQISEEEQRLQRRQTQGIAVIWIAEEDNCSKLLNFTFSKIYLPKQITDEKQNRIQFYIADGLLQTGLVMDKQLKQHSQDVQY